MKKPIGEIIKYLRQSNNLSQKEVADALNMSISAISQYETGKRNLSATEITLFADYFNVSTDYLLGREEVNTSDLLEKKLKLSYEITLTHKEYSPILEKVMMTLFYVSIIIFFFFPESEYLFAFAFISQICFILYMLFKKLGGNHKYKKTFTIPDDVSVYYEYKHGNFEFNRLRQILKVILFFMIGTQISVIIIGFNALPLFKEFDSYWLVQLITIAETICVFVEVFYSWKKNSFYKKIDYFKFGNYLKNTLALFIEIGSYLLLIVFLVMFLKSGQNSPLVIIFGIFLTFNQFLGYVYNAFLSHVLRSYDLKAMLNDTLEVKKLS